jgi:hypothetical protein
MRKLLMAKSAPKPAPKSATKPAAKTAFKTIAKPVPAAKPAPVAKAAPAPPPPAAPKPVFRTTGLSPKEQRLLALREKLAHKSSGAKPLPGASAQSFSAKSFTGKKTPFQRKAV